MQLLRDNAVQATLYDIYSSFMWRNKGVRNPRH